VLGEEETKKNTVFCLAIDEDAAFQKNTQFASPYYYFDQNKSIAWSYDGRDGL